MSRRKETGALFIMVAVALVFVGVMASGADAPQPAVRNVNTSANALAAALQRVDGVLANCTGVLINGEARGLTRVEHDQLKGDMQLLAAAVNAFTAANAPKPETDSAKAPTTPEAPTPETK